MLKALDSLGDDNENNRLLRMQIKKKFPRECIEFVHMRGTSHQDKKDKLSFLRESIPLYIAMKEDGDDNSSSPPPELNDISSTVLISHNRSQGTAPAQAPNPAPVQAPANQSNRSRGRRQPRVIKCHFCQQAHWSDQCEQYKTLTSRLAKASHLCKKCMSDKHKEDSCPAKVICPYCDSYKKHHRSLCPVKFGQHNTAPVHANVGLTDTNQDIHHMIAGVKYGNTLMQTAQATIMSTDERSTIKHTGSMFLDTGGGINCLRDMIAKKLKLVPYKSVLLDVYTFGCIRAKRMPCGVADIKVLLNDGTTLIMDVYIVPDICERVRRAALGNDITSALEEYENADRIPFDTTFDQIDILVGITHYWYIVEGEKKEIAKGLHLVKSKLGWILSGRQVHGSTDEANMLSIINGREGPISDALSNEVLQESIDSNTKVFHMTETSPSPEYPYGLCSVVDVEAAPDKDIITSPSTSNQERKGSIEDNIQSADRFPDVTESKLNLDTASPSVAITIGNSHDEQHQHPPTHIQDSSLLQPKTLRETAEEKILTESQDELFSTDFEPPLFLTDPKVMLEDFWSLEMLGIRDSMVPDNEMAIDSFQETVQYLEDQFRYEIGFPWNCEEEERRTLQENFGAALGRLKTIMKVLQKPGNEHLLKAYTEIINYQKQKGIIEAVPIYLPRKNHLTYKIIERIHRQELHAGTNQTLSSLRQKYWIPKGRTEVNFVIKRCFICTYYKGGAYKMPSMPAFPVEKVVQGIAYQFTGLDYAGPFWVVMPNLEKDKVWIILFTCLTIRSVTLEVVLSMTTEEFLLALRRFCSLRGTPKEIVCDNAQTIKAGARVLDAAWSEVISDKKTQSCLADKRIKWTFTLELASWTGGNFERMVQLLKQALQRTLHNKLVPLEVFRTIISEVQAMINSRPLTYVGENITDGEAITPSHFTAVNQKSIIPVMDKEDLDVYNPQETNRDAIVKAWSHGQEILKQFWQRWEKEYVLNLRERYQKLLPKHRIQSSYMPHVGAVVLIQGDEKTKRGSWSLGKIEELIYSKDGEVRAAVVKNGKGHLINRALCHLFPLEHDRPTVEDVSPKSQTPNPSQPQSQSQSSSVPNPNPISKNPMNSVGDTGLRWKALPQREAKTRASNRIKQLYHHDQDQDG